MQAAEKDVGAGNLESLERLGNHLTTGSVAQCDPDGIHLLGKIEAVWDVPHTRNPSGRRRSRRKQHGRAKRDCECVAHTPSAEVSPGLTPCGTLHGRSPECAGYPRRRWALRTSGPPPDTSPNACPTFLTFCPAGYRPPGSALRS